MKNYDNMVDAINDLKKRGYEKDFNLKANCIECGAIQLKLSPEEFEIEEVHRFEGDSSSPDSNSVIYAIESNEGVKGILVDAYGTYSEALTREMVNKLKIARS